MPEEVRADLLLGRDTLSPGLIKAGEAASKASGNVRQLTRDLYEAGKVRATPVVDLNDAAATAKLTDVTQRLRDLSAKVADPEIQVRDKAAQAAVATMRIKLDALGRKIASPRVTLDGLARAEAGILTLDAQLDALNRKGAIVSVGARRGLLSRLGGLAGGAGGAIGGSAGAIGSGFAGLGGGSGGILGAIAAALVLGPAAIPFALGTGTGLGGALLAGSLGSKGIQKLASDRQALARAQLAVAAPGPATASQRLTLQQAQAQFARDQARYGGFVPFGRGVNNLGQTALGTLLGALTGSSPGFSAGPHGQPGGSFLQGLTPIFKQLQGFVKSLGPELGDLFRSSLPFVQAFVKIMEQFAKAVLPAITQSLKIMQPDLPIIVQGFKLLAQGIAGFLINLGPGIKDSAIIFKAAMLVVKGILQFVGISAAALAYTIVKLAETVRKIAAAIPPYFDKMRHDIAQIFDNFRHDTAAIWDAIWRDTIGKVQAGYHAVVRWFQNLPGSVRAALGGLGKMLLGIATGSMNSFLSGLKSVGGSILSWIKNFFAGIPHAILSLLHMSPPHAGSVFFDLGANMMHHLEAGIQSRARSVFSRVGSVIGRGVGATSGGIQQLAFEIAKARGWAGQWGAIQAVEMAEAGWNLRARNPSSGAYGIAQFINGPSEYYTWGGNPNTAAGQIVAFYNYIAARYGTPSAAAAHEARFHWYGSGLQGGIFTQPTIIGVGDRPERVDITPLASPNRGGAAAQVVFEVRGSDSETSQFLVRLLKRHVRVAGGGNVQTAFTTSR